MNKLVFDTNVLIDWLNQGTHEAVICAPGVIRFMSAVVAMELLAGAKSRRAKNAVDALINRHRAVGRLAAPNSGAYVAAGQVLPRLKSAGREIKKTSLVNDLLIAITCRDIGAMLVTRDASDFVAIAAWVPFQLHVVG